MSAIATHHLRKTFNKNEVLKDVSFEAQQGQVIALLGSSGSGKSTLLRCINLLEIPDQGSIQYAEETLHFDKNNKSLSHQKMTTIRTKVGMVFQQFNLWGHLTILQNLITAPVHVLKQNQKEAIDYAETLLKKVGILEKKDQYPAQLSGGQQQRAAIARALMMKPKVMLFDEPTSALDPEMVTEVLMVMRSLAQEGMTMIVASHEMNFVRDVANHTIFLHEGTILEQGAPGDIFQNPQTERLKKFLESVVWKK